jgi:hypothetical protein
MLCRLRAWASALDLSCDGRYVLPASDSPTECGTCLTQRSGSNRVTPTGLSFNGPNGSRFNPQNPALRLLRATQGVSSLVGGPC